MSITHYPFLLNCDEVKMPKIRVFVDTNVILEAVRIGCWALLCNSHTIETVEKCIEETLTGNHLTPTEHKTIINGLAARHEPSKRDIANLILTHPESKGLDDGELHLFAWLYAQNILPNTLILISTADKAAIRATNIFGWINCHISLEKLLQQAGATRSKIESLHVHFKNAWLSSIKSKILLDSI